MFKSASERLISASTQRYCWTPSLALWSSVWVIPIGLEISLRPSQCTSRPSDLPISLVTVPVSFTDCQADAPAPSFSPWRTKPRR